MIPNWFMQRVSLTPDKTALITNEQQWTFEELYNQAVQYAQQIKTIHTQPNRRIALLGQSNEEMVFMIHACMLVGCEIVMLNNRLTDEELKWQIEDAQVETVLFADSFKERMKNFSVLMYSFSDVTKQKPTYFDIAEEWTADKTITVMYTSGTTGFPKGVRQTAQNHTSNALSSVLNLGLAQDDCWLCTMPLFHISGFSILVRSLIYGMSVRLYEKFDAPQITKEIVAGTVTRMSVVTVMLQQIIKELEDHQMHAHPSFKTMLAGGGAIPVDYLRRALDCGLPILQTYGMTETSSQTATLSSEDALKKIGSAGKPLFFNKIKIRDANKPNIYGEVLIQGPHVTPGYIGRFEETKALENGWLATGDIGYLDSEGYLYIVDRRSDLIISGGENIYPAEIENVLSEHPIVVEAGVCGKPDEKWGETPVAFVVTDKLVSEHTLLEFCQKKLAKYKIPTQIIFVEALPRNASNKLLRRDLKKWL